MAATFPILAAIVEAEYLVNGNRLAVIHVAFPVNVQLLGVPRYVLHDGLGNDHKCEGAKPHILDPLEYVDYVDLRFGTVPLFDSFTLTVPALDPHVIGPMGDTVEPGEYAVDNPFS